MYKKIAVKSLSYGSWVKLILISILPMFGLAFIAWAVSNLSGKNFLITLCSMGVGCLFSAMIAKFSLYATCLSLNLKVETND